uniref:Very-long-chain (3R)-3-hydroxyacyl-CoA dehydratase n=1 Tax=Glossina brevipalpis TaxID=37001 RepID=A0A1A9VZR8_9MUSC
MPDLRNKINVSLKKEEREQKLEMMQDCYSTSKTIVQQLSPFVYWAQTEEQITLKIELKDAKPLYIDFTPSAVKFKAKGYGARGLNEYQFYIEFYALINSEESSFRIFDSKIECIIKKSGKEWWPRLVATPQKPHWLKIDFDRWRTEDDALDEKPRDIRKDYYREYERLQKEEIGYIKESTKTVYMVFYNFAQFIGFLYILSVISILYYRDGPDIIPKTYENVGNAMKFVQLLQFLEILHPLFGYTKGNPLIPLAQVTGRNFVLFLMIECEERMQTKPVVFYLFIIWSLVEVIRYPYYLTAVVKKPLALLTWLRYTIWIPLYPMGILCEGIIILRNIPYFEETKRFSVEMPNQYNFTFDMTTFLKVYLLGFILPGSYILMTHMAKTRAKKLGKKRCIRRTED